MLRNIRYFELAEFLSSNLQSVNNLELAFEDEYFNDEQEANQLSNALSEYRNIRNLKLKLYSYNSTEKSAFNLGSSLNSCQHLSNLELNLYINWQLVSNFIQGLAKCINLNKLKIVFDNISDEGIIETAPHLTQIPSLQILELDLQEQNIGDSGVNHLGQCLSRCSKLKNIILKLDLNKIKEKNAPIFSPELENCKNLTSLLLDFTSNEVTDDILSQISQSLSYCKNLLHLNLVLENNQISNISSICNPLSNLKNLQILVLNFGCNNVSQQSVSELGLVLQQCISLISLNFWLNDQTISAFSQFLPYIPNLKDLKLALDNRWVSQKQEQQLSLIVLKLKKLVFKQIIRF
ncbi:hypothetical protein ABPG74_011228 [Tetrahymena malaccensis]